MFHFKIYIWILTGISKVQSLVDDDDDDDDILHFQRLWSSFFLCVLQFSRLSYSFWPLLFTLQRNLLLCLSTPAALRVPSSSSLSRREDAPRRFYCFTVSVRPLRKPLRVRAHWTGRACHCPASLVLMNKSTFLHTHRKKPEKHLNGI